ncbi:hypothetical protein BJ878DRAFT_568282 [Calycina marina]|uniref:Calcium-dependent phosphotriesterase n=1 Tax=Calycina marina TaxID=1763456 RepID=A0A9P7Z1N0_9HELO|nr:hypothetical protein BJ878DRAFT_568282 [Calycina marina]
MTYIEGLIKFELKEPNSYGNIASIPRQDLYLLPTDLLDNISTGFSNTTFSESSGYQILFDKASVAPFLSYDTESDALFGPSPAIQLVAQQYSFFAFEAGIWVPPRNEVWFTSSIYNSHRHSQWRYYHNGTIYFTNIGIANSTAGSGSGVMAIDSATRIATHVVNSYLGVPFNGIDDVTWANKYGRCPAPKDRPIYLPDTVWRFDPQEQLLLPVISDDDICIPNDFHINANNSVLYVSDSGGNTLFGGGVGSSGTLPAIYRFDLDDDMFPINKRLFGIAREGIAGGMHVDDYGRVCAVEFEGTTAQSSNGKVLGVFQGNYFVDSNMTVNEAKFAPAGDKVVVLAVEKIWVAQLEQSVVDANRYDI